MLKALAGESIFIDQLRSIKVGITDAALKRWHASLSVHADFSWPTVIDGEHTCSPGMMQTMPTTSLMACMATRWRYQQARRPPNAATQHAATPRAATRRAATRRAATPCALGLVSRCSPRQASIGGLTLTLALTLTPYQASIGACNSARPGMWDSAEDKAKYEATPNP